MSVSLLLDGTWHNYDNINTMSKLCHPRLDELLSCCPLTFSTAEIELKTIQMRGCGQCVCMGGGCVGVVSACAWEEDSWEEDSWVWSVCVHGRRTRGCGQCVCMGGRLVGVVSACAWEGHC